MQLCVWQASGDAIVPLVSKPSPSFASWVLKKQHFVVLGFIHEMSWRSFFFFSLWDFFVLQIMFTVASKFNHVWNHKRTLAIISLSLSLCGQVCINQSNWESFQGRWSAMANLLGYLLFHHTLGAWSRACVCMVNGFFHPPQSLLTISPISETQFVAKILMHATVDEPLSPPHLFVFFEFSSLLEFTAQLLLHMCSMAGKTLDFTKFCL